MFQRGGNIAGRRGTMKKPIFARSKSTRLKNSVQKIITLEPEELLSFCGQGDRKLKQLQSGTKAKIVARGNELRLSGSEEEVDRAYALITELLQVQRTSKQTLTGQQIHAATGNFGDDRPPQGHDPGSLSGKASPSR